ncbi:MAG: nuclear transport factor 2 family protein [Pseudomonadota bacterium]
MTEAEKLAALFAKQEITELLQRYARTLDWLDDEGQAQCFWPDADVDYGFFKGSAAEFLPIVMQIERDSVRRWHMLSPPSIDLKDITTAEVESYGIAAAVKPDVEGVLAGNMYGGRYLDTFERREEAGAPQWRISARTYVLEWRVPLDDQPSDEPDPKFALPILQIIKSGHPMYREM